MKKIISTTNAPKAIGPYSQAVMAGDTLYCSGQIAINPNDGTLNTPNIIIETNQVMQNLEAVLSEAEMTFVGENPPARETVEVSVLPKNVNVEISLIAVK